VYRWNEILLEEMQENFITLPLAARHLASFHTTLDDAITVAGQAKQPPSQPGIPTIDPVLQAGGHVQASAPVPSDHAAAAAAAILSYLFPARADIYAAKAKEARLLAGVEWPSSSAAGTMIGEKVAAIAINRAMQDQSDAKWTGTVPQGPDIWKGTNPIAPMAAKWRPRVLDSTGQYQRVPDQRVPARRPPSPASEQTKAALAELKCFVRTPKTNHRATYWEVHGGARAHTLWNEIARTKLLESNAPPSVAARVMAAVNVAMMDAGIACWDAKYTYWYIRPSQLDLDLKSVFPPPNHPSYPAAHGCFSTAAATVLAAVFPQDRDRLAALGKEAAQARIWASIHYRFDIEAGQQVGRGVAEKTLRRAYAGSGSQRTYVTCRRQTGQKAGRPAHARLVKRPLANSIQCQPTNR